MPHNDTNWLDGTIGHIKKTKRTEQEILKDFEALGWLITSQTETHIELNYDGLKLLIWKSDKTYMFDNFIDMQEHKLLNELFEVWQWI